MLRCDCSYAYGELGPVHKDRDILNPQVFLSRFKISPSTSNRESMRHRARDSSGTFALLLPLQREHR